MQERDKVRHLDQRPIDVMLRAGVLMKDSLGRCRINEARQ